MKENEIKQECLKLMSKADAGYLSTVDSDGFPQVRAMVNLRNKEQFPGLTSVFDEHQNDMLIYMTTDTSSKKFKQINENPKVSVYFCNAEQIEGLLLIGEMEVIADMNINITPLAKRLIKL